MYYYLYDVKTNITNAMNVMLNQLLIYYVCSSHIQALTQKSTMLFNYYYNGLEMTVTCGRSACSLTCVCAYLVNNVCFATFHLWKCDPGVNHFAYTLITLISLQFDYNQLGNCKKASLSCIVFSFDWHFCLSWCFFYMLDFFMR